MDISVEKTTTTITYISSFISVALAFMNQYAAAIGIIIAFATFLINWWFQLQKWKIEKAKLTKEELEKIDGD